MRITLNIADSLLDEARSVSRRDGTTLRALVEQGLRLALEERSQTIRFRLREASVDGLGLQPTAEGLSSDTLRELSYGDRGGSDRTN